jgi:hypothetical protein
MTTEMLKDPAEFDDIETQNPALQCLMGRVNAAIAAGRLRGDTFAISTMLWTVAHGAIALFIAAPHYPFGNKMDYAERIIDAAITGLAANEVAPLREKIAR